MKNPETIKSSREVEQIDEQIRKRLGVVKDEAKRPNFFFYYFLNHFLAVIGLFTFCLVAACGVIVFANYMTTIDIRNMGSSLDETFTLAPGHFFQLTLATAFFLFIIGMAFWYSAVKRFVSK